jgi:hypothetical protein
MDDSDDWSRMNIIVAIVPIMINIGVKIQIQTINRRFFDRKLSLKESF